MRAEKLKKLIKSGYTRCDAFTLAEVLITLGVIGVVAAVTLPELITNIQERIQKEQVRSAKYKLTLATDKMKSLGLLGEQYPTTEAFVNELSKHLKLAKVCNNDNLRECWTSDEINLSNGNTKSVSAIKTGTDLLALAAGARYGRSDITPYTVIASVQWTKTWDGSSYTDKTCEEKWKLKGWRDSEQIICIDKGTNTNIGNDNTATISLSGG